MRPILGIELDDSSYERPDRVRRDDFVRSVFRAARLPLLPIVARRSYDAWEADGLPLFYHLIPEYIDERL
jgi:hypothetical protein